MRPKGLLHCLRWHAFAHFSALFGGIMRLSYLSMTIDRKAFPSMKSLLTGGNVSATNEL